MQARWEMGRQAPTRKKLREGGKMGSVAAGEEEDSGGEEDGDGGRGRARRGGGGAVASSPCPAALRRLEQGEADHGTGSGWRS